MIGKIKENKMLKIVIFVLLDLVLAFVLTLPIVNGVKNEKIELKDGSFVNNSNSNPFTLDKGIYILRVGNSLRLSHPWRVPYLVAKM